MHLLKNLEHFLSSFLSSKEFYAALIGALIGGLLTGRYALRAQKQAAEDQRQRDQETERRAVNGTLQAIATELKILKSDCLDPLEKRLKELVRQREEARKNRLNEPPPLAMIRTEENRVTVFESNAGMLGKIENRELREKIVRVYGLNAGLLDSLNACARDFERWRSLHSADPEKSIIGTMLEDFQIWILNGLGDLQGELAELLPKIEKYINT